MPRELRAISTQIFTLLVMLSLTSCAHEKASVTPAHRCGDSPVESATQAKNRAICEFETISELCASPAEIRWEISRRDNLWEVRSIPSSAACKTWVATLRATDGVLMKFSRIP